MIPYEDIERAAPGTGFVRIIDPFLHQFGSLAKEENVFCVFLKKAEPYKFVWDSSSGKCLAFFAFQL